jgi:hypothetical protein
MTQGKSPLWVKHPDIPWGSIGWRMGWGEAYWGEWRNFFLALNEKDRHRYRESWPEPESWRGLYAFIESGEPPPWAIEHKRKLTGPYPAPSTDESSISEHYRVVWLVRHHMRKLGVYEVPARFPSPYLGQAPDEDNVTFYSEPNGAWWRLSMPKNGGLILNRLTQANAPETLLFCKL